MTLERAHEFFPDYVSLRERPHLSRLLRVAERAGVRWSWLLEGDPRIFTDSPGFSSGPRGHQMSLKKKEILLNPPTDRMREDQVAVVDQVAVLHEIAHAYTHPPFFSLEDCPEDFVLMQWERSVARHCTPGIYDAVVEWQMESEAKHPDCALHAVYEQCGVSYTHTSWWRSGFALLRKLGGLTTRGRPTFRPLAWHLVKPSLVRKMEACFEEGGDMMRLVEEFGS
jgi:hypothetical protein